MTEQLDLAMSYAAIADNVVVFFGKRDVIRVVGPQALTYLDGQCSQQLTTLVVGNATETLILSPQGKIDVVATIVRTGDEEVLVVVPEGFGDATFERLRRFKLRVKAELEQSVLHIAQIRGPKSPEPDTVEGGVAAYAVSWHKCDGIDVLFADAIPIAVNTIAVGDRAALDLARIRAGIALMGPDISEGVIPQETGLVDRTVSFTKGCFTGQELVARLDARGNRVPRRLLGVVLDAPGVHASELVHGSVATAEREIGRITSAQAVPGEDRVWALAYIRREVDPGAAVTVTAGTTSIAAVIVELPIPD